ncbi:bifunctional DNA primase/polymerase [Streptomyces sp. NPDC001634]|uniref:bifunctional DNA primase/polymerase n=1 Tax=Streptomyces sp. NPDC001634 TaxID=3154390 RepID=UPI00332D17E1
MSWWTNARDDALRAAEHDFKVLPLSLSKLPAIKSPHDKGHSCKGECGLLGHGVHDASSDPDRIRDMFRAAPHATGYGTACRVPPNYLIGLDLDIKNGVNGVAELRRLADEYEFAIPRTVAVRTAGTPGTPGGWHLWLSGPPDVAVSNSAGRVAPGIDVRGAGGYLVGPGSRGKKGLYRLVGDPDDFTVAPMPEALLRLVTAVKEQPRRERPFRTPIGPGAAGKVLVGLVRLVLDAREGQRNDRLYWAAARAYEHAAAGRLDENAAERALIRAAVEAGLPESEAQRTVASARGTSTGVAR